MPPVRRAAIKAAPTWLRQRLLLRLGGQLVKSSYQGSRVVATVRRGTAANRRARVDLLLGPRAGGHPLCGFYAAAFTRLLWRCST